MPLITLTTDFGTSDHFVGTMKGVILRIAPQTRIVDITHEVAPFDVIEAGLLIAQAWPYFPKKTIHVVVVDPGVGSERRPILVEAAGQFFIAPDNGVLSMVFDAAKCKTRIISNPKFMLKEVSRTFHGRDVFAPAAAHLARGISPAQFGRTITDYVKSATMKPTSISRHHWAGVILRADRFGNLITNFHITDFGDIKLCPFVLRAGIVEIRRLVANYSEAAVAEAFAIVGSSGYIEISANQVSAAKLLGCGAGAPIELELFYD